MDGQFQRRGLIKLIRMSSDQGAYLLEAQGRLEVHHSGQEATSTHKPVADCRENISTAGYKFVCLNARSIVNKKNELKHYGRRY